jgi:hypothetical protein
MNQNSAWPQNGAKNNALYMNLHLLFEPVLFVYYLFTNNVYVLGGELCAQPWEFTLPFFVRVYCPTKIQPMYVSLWINIIQIKMINGLSNLWNLKPDGKKLLTDVGGSNFRNKVCRSQHSQHIYCRIAIWFRYIHTQILFYYFSLGPVCRL